MIAPLPSTVKVRFVEATVIPGLDLESLTFSVSGFSFNVLKASPVHLGRAFLPDNHYDRYGQALKES